MTSLPSFNDFPAQAPPPGVVPNLVHPYSKGYILLTVNTVFYTLMILFLVIRLYAKVFIIKKFFIDDITCFLAALGTTAYYISSVIDVTDGPVGKHEWDVTVGEITSKEYLVNTAYMSVVLLSPTLLATKLTFLLLYLQIFKPFRWMKLSCYFGIVLTSSFYISSWIVQMYLETPKHGQTWLSAALSGNYLLVQHISVAFSVVGLGIDIYLLVLPIGAVLRLQIPLQRKIGISLIFLTGLFACIASGLSVYFRVLDNQTPDNTWATQNVVIVALLEPLLGIIVSCMPSTAKVFSHHVSLYNSLTSLLPAKWFNSNVSSTPPSNYRSHNRTNGLSFHALPSEGSQPRSQPSMATNDASSSLRSYIDREIQAPISYELNNLQSVNTFIHASNKKISPAVQDDQIHLKQEIWQAHK